MSKTRLTITISPEILRQLDKLIDGKTIRNRSHAIEYMLNQQMMNQVHQAVILAGGSQDAISRATSPVAGQAVINHLINLLKSYGITQIFILTDQDTPPLDLLIDEDPGVTIIQQPHNLGTAGALVAASHLFSPSPIVVMHGDIFTNINLIDLIHFHQEHADEATICVKPKLNQQEFGKAIMQGYRVMRFLSKPETSEVGMVNIGVYLINPNILRDLPKIQPLMLETDVFPKLAEQNQLGGFLFEGIWYDVGNQASNK